MPSSVRKFFVERVAVARLWRLEVETRADAVVPISRAGKAGPGVHAREAWVSEKQDRAFVLARELLQEANELPDLGAVIFLSAEHVGEHVESGEARLEIGHIGVQRAVRFGRLNLPLYERAEH
jgi:hypothetical protein